MLRFLVRLTRMDRVRNGDIRETAQVERFEDMRQFGHVQMRDGRYNGQRISTMELLGRRKRERPVSII